MAGLFTLRNLPFPLLAIIIWSEFRIAATYRARRYVFCAPTPGLPRFSPSNGNKVVHFADLPSRRSILLTTNDIAALAQPLHINKLHNAYVVEVLIQLTIESIEEIIVNTHRAEDLT